MKLALRYIPTEVWVDVICYPWITRKKLGKIVHKFRNRYFAEILQYCLHERGKQTLGEVHLDKKAIIPRTPMPENIRFFERIEISHFDSSTLDFLHQISPLFTGVNLRFKFCDDLTNLRPILDHLSPMLHGIHSMKFERSAVPLIQQYFGPKLAQIKMLSIILISLLERFDLTTFQACINFCMDWLTSKERDPAEPRYLDACIYAENFQQFSMAVQKQFHSAKTAFTFAIKLFWFGNNNDVADFHLENGLGEQLHGQFDGLLTFQIYRHPQNAGTALGEWVEETSIKRYNSNGIDIGRRVTIGQIDANDGNNEEADNAGEEEDGPSTSKKPKMT